jgi:site-specific recombinase
MNFLVSFGLTLAVAIESRKVKGVHWRSQLRALRKLIFSDPLYFFLPLPPRKSTLDDEISND